MNVLRMRLLMAALTGLFLMVGLLVGGAAGMAITFLFAAATNILAWWNSDKVVLSLYDARAVEAVAAPDLVHLVAALPQKAGLPVPQTCIAENPQPNAFATGRNP